MAHQKWISSFCGKNRTKSKRNQLFGQGFHRVCIRRHHHWSLHFFPASEPRGLPEQAPKQAFFPIPQLLPVFDSILFLLFCPEISLAPLSTRSSWHSRVTVHSNHMPIDRCFVHSRDAKLINIKDSGAMHLFVVVSLGFFFWRDVRSVSVI